MPAHPVRTWLSRRGIQLDADLLFAFSVVLAPEALLALATRLVAGEVTIHPGFYCPDVHPDRLSMVFSTPDGTTRGVTTRALPNVAAYALFADYLSLAGRMG